MDFDLKAVSVAPREEGPPQSIVFMLHGFGGNGREMLNHTPAWSKRLPHTLFLAIEAPEQCELTPENPALHQWFSLSNPSHGALWDGAARVAPSINAFIDRVLDFEKIPASRAVLLGFCQGATMALFATMARATPLGGTLTFSGALIPPLPGVDVTLPQSQFMLVHGDADPVVPFAAMESAEKTLTGLGAKVQTVACPECDHSMDDRGMSMGGDFMERVCHSS